jgi:hypothetical protein
MIEINTYLGSVKFDTKKLDPANPAHALALKFFPVQWNEVDVIIFKPKSAAYKTDAHMSDLLAYLRAEGFIGEDGNFLIEMESPAAL